MVKRVLWPLWNGRQDGPFKLERIIKALELLQNPHKTLQNVIHVAGTNGKGSTTSFIESIIKETGKTVNVYTSPNLVHINERIKLNGTYISDDHLTSTLEEVKSILQKHNFENELSFFEGITVAAFYAFNKFSAEYNIIEVGLGGRFDATNVVDPIVSVITPISFDHMEYLGNTIQKIAYEKAGIIKPNSLTIISKQDYPEAYQVFKDVNLKQKNNKLVEYGTDFEIIENKNNKDNFAFTLINKAKDGNTYRITNPSLVGAHQYYNASNAIIACLNLDKIKHLITENLINKALQNTRWRGRLESITKGIAVDILGQNFEITIDGGHNEGSTSIIKNYLESVSSKYNKINIVYGALQRKNIDLIASKMQFLNEYNYEIFAVNINSSETCQTPYNIYNTFKNNNLKCTESQNIETCLKNIANTKKNNRKELILIYGSLYLIGEFISWNENI